MRDARRNVSICFYLCSIHFISKEYLIWRMNALKHWYITLSIRCWKNTIYMSNILFLEPWRWAHDVLARRRCLNCLHDFLFMDIKMKFVICGGGSCEKNMERGFQKNTVGFKKYNLQRMRIYEYWNGENVRNLFKHSTFK